MRWNQFSTREWRKKDLIVTIAGKRYSFISLSACGTMLNAMSLVDGSRWSIYFRDVDGQESSGVVENSELLKALES